MSRIKKNYLNKHVISSFSGLPAVIKQNKNTSPVTITNELEKLPEWTLFRPVRNKYPTRKYRVFFPLQLWSLDLMDVQKDSKFNEGVRYVLLCVDSFSKYIRYYTKPILIFTNRVNNLNSF